MKFWRSLAFLFALAAAAVCQSTYSQGPAPPSQQTQDAVQRPPNPGPGTSSGGSAADYNADATTTIVKTVNEVNLVFTVTDRHGHFIKDLKRDDIKVLDDNKPAAISSFNSQTDLPLRVGLLIDASSSIRDRFRFEQEAAIDLSESDYPSLVRRGVCAWVRFRL